MGDGCQGRGKQGPYRRSEPGGELQTFEHRVERRANAHYRTGKRIQLSDGAPHRLMGWCRPVTAAPSVVTLPGLASVTPATVARS